jgi:hypothetical protein
MKHIESIQPEYAADDMTALLLSDATASAALTALLHSVTGCAIPPTADTPQSEVEELVPLCLSILRRHWTTPLTALGDGTTPMSLADLMRRLIGDRVQGNEAWSIPAIHANIPTAVSALCDRKIDAGFDECPDGISLAQVLCSDIAITEMHDTNKGWTMTKRLPFYKNLHSITIGCKDIVGPVDTIRESLFYCTGEFRADELESCMTAYFDVNLLNGGSGETLTLPKLHTFGAGTYGSMIVNSDYRRIVLPALRNYYINNHYYNLEALVRNSSVEILECPVLYGCASSNATNVNLIANNPNLRYVDLRGFTKKNINIVRNCPQLETLILGKITEWSAPDKGDAAYHEFEKEENLIHLEFGEGSAASIKLPYWSPTTALSERLPEFLSNFKTYIAQRLTDKGSGLTLTLSQAVRDAIQTDPSIVSIITSKGWTISPAPSV